MKKKNSENIFNSREHLSKIKPYVPGRSIQDVVQELGIKDCIKMASNENPLGCPVTSEQLSSMLKTAHHYPDLNASDLLGLLSKLWGLESNQFVVGNGSDEILQMLAFAFLDPGDEVVTSWHTFSEYEFVANLCAAETIAVPMTEFTYDCEALADAVTEKTKLIFIANPNNHTNYQWEARLNNISFSTYKDTIQKDIDSESFRSNTNYDTYESQLNTLNHKLDSLKLNHYSKQRTETSSETSDEIPGKHPNKKHVTTTRLSPTQKEQARKIAMASKGAKKPISSPKKQIKTQPDRDDQYWENIEFLIECRRENHYLS